MTDSDDPLLILVPGAWMGAWIWDDTIERLQVNGRAATAITLAGLEPGWPAAEAAAIGLDDHVNQLVEFVERQSSASVVLVGHSYSGMVVAQAADRIPNLVARSIHVSTFLPRHGRSLIDDWGPDQEARDAERAQIHEDEMLWAPPPKEALEGESDLTNEQREWLGQRFVPHPGCTVLDEASLSEPVTTQPITFISSAATGADPLDDLPPEFANGTPDLWSLRTMNGGHWPMVTDPDTFVAHLIESASRGDV